MVLPVHVVTNSKVENGKQQQQQQNHVKWIRWEKKGREPKPCKKRT